MKHSDHTPKNQPLSPGKAAPKPSRPLIARDGLSLVELLVALALLSMLSVAAIQLVNQTENNLYVDQKQLVTSQQGDAIANYIYEEFESGTIADMPASRPYSNPNLPTDLQNGTPMTLVSLFGNDSRFNVVEPKCTLVEDVVAGASSFKFNGMCQQRGGVPINTAINNLLALGVKITLSIEGVSSRCIISQPIVTTGPGTVAEVTVDSPQCLSKGGAPAESGAHILFPRFVAYSTQSPAEFHTSFIEPVSPPTPGIGLEMADNQTVIGGAIVNPYPHVLVRASLAGSLVQLGLRTGNNAARLGISNAPPSVSVNGLNTSSLLMSGPIDDVKQALDRLTYASKDDWFGEDRLYAVLRAGPLTKQDNTLLFVKPNCGGQTRGTAILFEMGTITPGVGFTVNQSITSVTVVGQQFPRTQYGYCGYNDNNQRFIRYDKPDGTPTLFEPFPSTTESICRLAKNANPAIVNAGTDLYTPGPFIQYSPRARGQAPNAVSVYLYEQFLSGWNNDINAFSLFFNFDSFDDTGGTVKFTLNNIEQGRDLDNKQDPYVVLDDPSDFSPNIIGSDGTLTANAAWQKPNDGVVVPLRLPTGTPTGTPPLYDLSSYNQDPDLDGVTDPNLVLQNWTGLDRWVIWGTSEDGMSVGFRQVPFDNATANPKTTIQLNVAKSQRCS